MGKKFNEQMICCCNLSRKWWWGSIHVFDSPIKFLNYLDKEGSIDFDTTNIEKVTVAYLCNRVGDDGGEWEGTDSHWAVCNPTDKGAFAVWEINLSDSSNPTPANPLLPDIVSHVCQKCGDFFKVHYTSKVFLCPACIPVPSTPASIPLPPDELLTDEESFNLGFKTSYKAESTELFAYSEGVQDGAKAQLLKCHQSEAAEIASLQADIEELNILFRGNSEVYEARIKELQKYKQPEYEKAILQQAKSESRSQAFRDVGYEMMLHVRAEPSLPPRWVADLITKLKSGQSPKEV